MISTATPTSSVSGATSEFGRRERRLDSAMNESVFTSQSALREEIGRKNTRSAAGCVLGLQRTLRIPVVAECLLRRIANSASVAIQG